MGVRMLMAVVLLLALQLPSKAQLGKEYTGKASFYGNEFVGRKTANGEIYGHMGMTAAHRSLPFGTLVEVTNLHNNKTCVVRINDRGPFAKGRVIDLTNSAAKAIGFIKSGIAEVKLRIVGFDGMLLLGQDEYLIDNTAQLLTGLRSAKAR
jgi:rare lipoprotein A